ncbi:MAG: FAD-dependent thymidylate synthase [Actinomycetota bacterium]|nr:FAD-dependent thymidylate synthase [Actinomycetota bacterium]
METTERNTEPARQLFEELGGTVKDGFPAIHSQVYHTKSGTPYLKTPGVVVLAKPQTNVAGLGGFLEGFDPDLRFTEYLDDPTRLPDSSQLCKTAGQTCFDEETEILTDEGWKPFAELNREELVLTMNPRTGRAEYQRPLAYQRFDYDGFMFGFESPSLSFLTTPDHRQWAKTHGAAEYRFHSTWKIANKKFLVRTASDGWQGTIPSLVEISGFDFSQRLSNHTGRDYGTRASSVPPITFDRQEEIRALALLCVYYATEGSLHKGEGEGVVIYGDHADEVKRIAEVLGLTAHTYVDRRNGCPRTMVHGGKRISRFFQEECGKGSQNKRLPAWVLNLPSDWLKELWDVLVKTDGHVQTGSGTEYLSTTSTTLAGQAQEILCKIGYGSRVRTNKSLEGRLQTYSVCRKTRKQTYANTGHRIEGKSYSGSVYCVTTENGIVFVRRNGKPHFSGNCYMSFGPRRTTNENAAAYIERLTSAGHGSVLEHSSFNFLLYGISRSVTHELVRHRAGVAISQISQRYVSGSVLRFVERPEYQEDQELHRTFEERADRAASEYEAMAELLLERQEGGASMLTADYRTDARKKVQQTARSLLPNETEAPMVFTGNVRALRHIIEMRADAHAESEIRNLALRLFLCLRTVDPILFGDYDLGELPDGTYTVSTKNRKA